VYAVCYYSLLFFFFFVKSDVKHENWSNARCCDFFLRIFLSSTIFIPPRRSHTLTLSYGMLESHYVKNKNRIISRKTVARFFFRFGPIAVRPCGWGCGPRSSPFSFFFRAVLCTRNLGTVHLPDHTSDIIC